MLLDLRSLEELAVPVVFIVSATGSAVTSETRTLALVVGSSASARGLDDRAVAVGMDGRGVGLSSDLRSAAESVEDTVTRKGMDLTNSTRGN